MRRIIRIDDVKNGTGVTSEPIVELPMFTRDGKRGDYVRGVYFIRPNGTPQGEVIGPDHPEYSRLLSERHPGGKDGG